MTWWRRLWFRKRLEQHASDLIARGHALDQTHRRARLLFGGAEQVKEHRRDARGTRWLEDLVQDFGMRFARCGRNPASRQLHLTLALARARPLSCSLLSTVSS